MSKFKIVALLLAIMAVIGISSCSFDSGDSDSGDSGAVEEQLQFDTLTRAVFMGGSLMYNPDRSVGGQLTNGAKVAVRLSKVDPAQNNAEVGEPEYGYITVKSVDVASITVEYTAYNGEGVKQAPITSSIALDAPGDINNDGKDD